MCGELHGNLFPRSSFYLKQLGKFVQMTKVRISGTASDLCAAHAVAQVLQFHHGRLFNGLCESRPAAATLKLIRGGKERLAGHDIHIDALFELVPELAREGALRAACLLYTSCILIVHHTRKQPAGDSFEKISGTTGLSGCADGALIMQKEKHALGRIPKLFIYSRRFLPFVGSNPLYRQCLGVKRVGQHPLQGFHLGMSAFLLSLYNTRL